MRVAPVRSPIVGRDAVLDELVALALGAVAGEGSLVVLAGEAGIGKTSVAQALARRVSDRLVVTWGACAADRSAPPFWPWTPLVEIDDADHALSRDPAVGAARFERLSALRARISDRAAAGPLLHVMEDLQWADVASVLLLAHLGSVIAEVPLLVVATMRTGEPRPDALDDALADARRLARLVTLPALDTVDVATLLRSSGVASDERTAQLVMSRTGGNPLFVSELLRAVSLGPEDRQREVLTRAVPERVADLVVGRLGRLPADVVDLLGTAAVLGADGDVGTLAVAHGLDDPTLLDLVGQGRAAHLLDTAAPGRWCFRHAVVRDAVLDTLSGSDRARRHASALEAVAASATASPATVAHHALAALPLVDADRAVALAARAAEAAFARYAYEEAVWWAEQAVRAAPAETSPRWRVELLLLSGEANRHIGDMVSARGAFVAAAELTEEPALLARAALGYADPGADLGIAYRTYDDVTATLLERAIEAQPSMDTTTGVQLEARLAAELYFSDDPGRARALAASALDRAGRIGDPRSRCLAAAVDHDAFVVGQAELPAQLDGSSRLLEWARADGSTASRLTAHRARVLDLLAAGDLVGMDAEIVAFRRLAEPLRAPGYLWWPALWSAMRALLDGRHDDAERLASTAHDLGAASFPMLAAANLTFLHFFLRREQGRLGELEQATREFAAANADIPAVRASLVFLLAEIGKLDEAGDALRGFDDDALGSLHDRNWPASWFQLARAASIVGDEALASRLLAARPPERCVQVSLATVCLGATDLATGWLLWTIGEVDPAVDAYRSAAELDARICARSWLAQTRAELAVLLRQRGRPGDRDEAEELERLAAAAAREIGLATVAVGSVPEPTPAAPATFRRAGAVWEVTFGERTARLSDARGMHDIVELLRRPGVAVSVLELEDGHEAGRRAPVRGAAALDERARREIRARLHELDEDEAAAEAAGDGEGAALAREQRQSLAEAVARDFGLRGRSRLVGDPVERARKTVSTRIRRTITTIGRSHPELGRHLERSIDTGAWCAYRPAEPVVWQT